jgi:YD repeat-containing protein
LFFPASIQAQGGTTRTLYDQNGRVTAVILPNGEANIYHYDAAGNLTSITREVANVISVIAFTPEIGAVGTAVVIYGTGFSANASQNTVAFNGVQAVVTSSTGTELVTSVPEGATTGLISVTSPLGSVTGAMPFTVANAPSIASFAPTVGKPGDVITISGNNFASEVRNNEINFNESLAPTSSATETELVTSVPYTASSGHISVTTPTGNAVSTDDFFIAPDNINPSDVVTTGRITFGEVKYMSLSPAGKVALVVFDGAAGQRVSLDLFNADFRSDVSIIGPRGDVLVPPTTTDYTYRGVFIDPHTLPVTGSYTILIDTSRYYSGGNFALKLYDVPPDTIAPIELDGPPVTFANSVPGQNGRMTFNGTAGQRVNITGSITQTESTGYLSVYRPDGTLLVGPTFMSHTFVFSPRLAFIDNLLLPTTGTYTILVDPWISYLNSTDVTLSTPPTDVVETITPGGPPVTISTTLGQNARLNFTATPGERVSLNLSNVSIGISRVAILDPNGSTVVYDYIYNGGSARFFDAQTLWSGGTYTIFVDPLEAYTGNMTLTLYDVPPDATGSLTIGGPPLSLTIGTPGQNGQVTFDGTAGQHVSLNISDVSIVNSNVYIYDPNGFSLVYGTYVNTSGKLFSNLTLPTDGTYRIVIDPYGNPTGDMTLALYESNPPELTGTIETDGAPLDVTFERPEQNARITFDGTAGQTLNLAFSNVTVTRSRVSLSRPDGTVIFGPALITTDGGALTFEALPETGTYTILIDPDLAYTGSMRLTLTRVVDVTGAFVIGGPAVNIQTLPAQNARLTFSGTAGQRLFLNFSNISGIYESYVSIFNPDGTTLVDSIRLGSYAQAFDVHTLPATGTYTLLIDPSSTYSGSMTLQATAAGSLEVFGPSVTEVITAPQQSASVTFSGNAGDRINLFTSDNTIPDGNISIYKPDGTLLITSNLYGIYNQLLPVNGTYTITIVPADGYAGRIMLSLGFGGGGSGGPVLD